jgi:hypothetical protein
MHVSSSKISLVDWGGLRAGRRRETQAYAEDVVREMQLHRSAWIRVEALPFRRAGCAA